MMFLRKGSLLLPFCLLLLFSFSAHSKQSSLHDIANDPRWPALLHLIDDQPQISGDFLLSAPNFSLQNELQATLALLRSTSDQRCRFIARHYFLTTIHRLDLPPLDCSGFEQFRQAVPMDRLSIIYASENLLQPASIMGHTMLAMESYDQRTQHAFSFFTELNLYNPFNLIWDNLIQGQPGFITVQPLQQALKPYKDEQRNVWVYELDFSHAQKALLQRHLWELKSAQLTYLFNAHNCATLILDILAIAEPKLAVDRQRWVSPVDVAKATHKAQLIKTTRLHGSSEWKVRSLSQVTKPYGNESVEPISKPLALMLSNEINDHRYQFGLIDDARWKTEQSRLNQVADISNLNLSVDQGKNPLFRRSDSQWGLSVLQTQHSQKVVLDWMPASHHLIDDNRSYASENALEILNLSMSFERDNLTLHEAKVYHITSYLKHNPYIGGWSGEFGIGLRKDPQFDGHMTGYLEGGIGKTYGLHKDIDVFMLWNLGGQINNDKGNLNHGPKAGIILRLIGPSKLIASHRYLWQSQFSAAEETQIDMAWHLAKNINLTLKGKRLALAGATNRDEVSLGITFAY